MVKLKPGDRIDCLLNLKQIVSPYNSDFTDIKTFEIIGSDKKGYYIYVPNYLYLDDSIKLDRYLCKQLQIDIRYLNSAILYVAEKMIYKINSIMDGCQCSHCKEFYYMACANQEDGTFICRECLFDPYR